ncbi:hypothetical protein BGX34_002035 [Mortierella sp. NVP85]|nr:hypothetical protein BGX34_002035 [Mortierella sp. NVP85]
MLFRKYLLSLLSVSAVFAAAEYDALVSGALFNGIDTTRPGHQGLSIFADSRNHPSAVASILLYLANKSRFTPKRSKNGVIRDGTSYRLFARQSVTFPAFVKRYQTYVELELHTGDREELAEKIEEWYEAQMADPRQIGIAFQNLVPKYIEGGIGDDLDNDSLEMDEDSLQWDMYNRFSTHPRWFGRRQEEAPQATTSTWLLSHIVVYSEPHVSPSFELSSISLKLSRDPRTGKAHIVPQKIVLEQTMFSVDSEYLKQRAEYFAEFVETVKMNRFLDEISTYSNQDAV